MPRTQEIILSASADRFELDIARDAATNVIVKLTAAAFPYVFLRMARWPRLDRKAIRARVTMHRHG
ncbi:MAG: hypothetical protein MN733_25200 [Nitrososphaera sp.]|nr:hypothetical protein [Nitrososphaera sp.]